MHLAEAGDEGTKNKPLNESVRPEEGPRSHSTVMPKRDCASVKAISSTCRQSRERNVDPPQAQPHTRGGVRMTTSADGISRGSWHLTQVPPNHLRENTCDRSFRGFRRQRPHPLQEKKLVDSLSPPQINSGCQERLCAGPTDHLGNRNSAPPEAPRHAVGSFTKAAAQTTISRTAVFVTQRAPDTGGTSSPTWQPRANSNTLARG